MMLVQRKNRVLNALLYRALILSAVRQGFHTVYYRQNAAAPSHDGPPVILFANHSAWWDAHMVMVFNEQVWHRDGYVMVEDVQLSRYQFFRYMGAFSVSRTNPRTAVASIKYAADLLRISPNCVLLIFPQGEILANDLRPLRFFRGVGNIARESAPCLAYPLALRYEFIGEQKPEAFISVGAPLQIEAASTTTKDLTNEMTNRLAIELDLLHADIVARDFSRFTPLVRGSFSINRLWDTVRGRRQFKSLGPD
jgi:chlorobactene lauroyltransferase